MSTALTTLTAGKLRLATRRAMAVRDDSKLKVAFVAAGATFLWLGFFVLARGLLGGLGSALDGFAAGTGPALADLLIARLVSLAGLALLALLLVSNLTIAHAGFFRSDETRFLLAKPLAPETLLLVRYGEGLAMSSWASAYLASPALLAYGLVREAPITYYPLAVCLGLAFALVPAALGVLVVVTGGRLVHGLGKRPRMALAFGVVIAFASVLRMSIVLPAADELSPQTVLAFLSFGNHALLPSTWLADGLIAAADGRLADTGFALLLLVSSALLILWLAAISARLWLVRMLTDPAGNSRSGRRRSLLGRLERLFGLLPQPARALVVKDIRLFWRDPAQWIQFLLFFGLLALYAGNLDDASAMAATAAWRSWIAVLNVAVCLLVLATLTTRFVFPLISLEGRRWWLLGLSPVALGTVLRLKLVLAATTSASITVGLAVLSAQRLDLAPSAFGLTVLAVLLATVALSGLAVGLGGLYPNFDQDQPAKIVSGLGGTLNFLLSMVYVAFVVVGLGLVLHAGNPGPILVAGVASTLALLSAITCWLPMRLGRQNLDRLGFG